MSETLLQAVLRLLDSDDSVEIPHYSIAHYPPEQIAQLTSEGILYPAPDATEIPRPARFGPGPDLIIRKTSRGIEGVADENDYFHPVLLSREDVRQYEVSAAGITAKLRKENGITGSGFRNDNGLISVGQKPVDGAGTADVYLSFPNDAEEAVVARCRRLAGLDPQRRVLLLTPAALCFSTETAHALASSGIVTVALSHLATDGRLALDWQAALGIRSRAVMVAVSGRKPRGFAANGEDHQKVVDVVSKIGSEWSFHLDDVCRQLHAADALFPKSLRDQEYVDSWDELADDIVGLGNSARRERVSKYIKYRINWVLRNQAAEKSLAKVSR